uniref:InlB B-repeat-containing protein n=1 Tax=Bifidobacterium adolescentis TaxID=1680 RepID=UPI00359CA786
MGFLTRLLAGLLAASTLGAGLAGTAGAADTTGATGDAKGVVKLASDDTSGLPDHLVNGDFSVNYKDQWLTGGWNWTSITPDGKYLNSVRNWNDSATTWKTVNGWDKTKFGWSSTQKDGTDNIQHKAGAVEIQYDDQADNVYAELCAYEAGTAIYQDIKTVPGTLYKVRLKHASLYDGYLDKMQVMIGAPGHEQPVEMTRTGVNGNGDKLNEKSNIIATKVSNTGENDRNHDSQWESYEGTYPIPAGQTVTRFTFRSVGSRNLDHGNLLDDIVFDKAYRLSYDKNASDATGKVPSNQRGKENAVEPAESKTTGNVKTVADNTSNLPDHLVNGTFDYRGNEIINENQRVYGRHDTTYLAIISAKTGVIDNPLHSKLDNWDPGQFGWSSNDDTNGGAAVEVQRRNHTPYPTDAGNVWGEIAAAKRGRYIYQDIATTPGVMYKWSLKHASRNAGQDDSMQVKIGEPGKTVAQQATRTTSNGSDKTGSVGTTITTHGTAQDGKWETYTGTYIATSTVTRFTFRSVRDSNGQGLDFTAEGNCVDDLSFDKAYKLSYDKNATDANGSVPSSQYGKENTVQPAKAKTAGTVRTVADKTASGLTVHDLKNGEIAPVQYGDFKFSTVNGFSADQVTNVNGFTVKTNWDPCEENQAYAGVLATMYQPNGNGANLILHHVGQWRDSSGTQRWLNARITVNGQNLGTLVYIPSTRKFVASYGKWDKHPSSRPYMDVTVDFLLDDGSTPQGLRGATGFTDIDGGTSGYNEGVELVSGFDGTYVRSDAHLARFGTNGWGGITDENKHDADAHGMKHYVGATFTGSSFRVRWSVASGQARQSGFQPVDSTIAYRLTYNKNAQDATGSIPSDTAADTIRPAKSETDGKVSDLVQRTTTHEDGSVTVKTIDTSTDVVSGCQVYYPAGQRITLATMAKDDDCWDSSMLSRPGHTQLGWNQDRNATQAQAQITMVEGGMTVYAVWVGNPVLTYDTNKPSTWSGQMPSTPASVSVPYNTAAADGSGWQSGDTTKIKGYRFLGWYTTPQDGSNLYDWNTPLTGSVTVYAHWQRLQANVVYNANGGTGSHPNTTGWQYSDVTIPGDTSKSFKRDKYVFKGWGTKPGKADVVYKDGSKVALQDKDITLYAQWQEVHENFVETGGIGLPIAIAGGVLLLMFGIGSTVMLTRRMNGHGMPDDE